MSRTRILPLGFVVLTLSIGATTCQSAPKILASGILLGQATTVAVDSELAKYYLESHSRTHIRPNPDYDKVIAEVHERSDGRPLDRTLLREVSETTSPDVATLYFIRRILAMPESERLMRRFAEELTCIRQDDLCKESDAPRALYGNYEVLFVPGFHYKSDPSTGADFGTPRRFLAQRGIKVELIEIEEDGAIENNARIIAERIREASRNSQSLILVSTSKGGPETALALGKLLAEEETRRVKAWVSVGGLLQGTLLADNARWFPKWWLTKIVFFMLGIGSESVEGMTTEISRQRFAELSFPKHILLLQYVGVPLSGHISHDVRGRYTRLREFGPNDGLTLLADELVPNGRVVLELGLDHFYRDLEMPLKALALAHVVMMELEQK